MRLHKDKECLTLLVFIGQAHKKYNFSTKFRAMIGSSRKSVSRVIEDGFELLPGEKIDVGETPEEALVREIKEELDTEVEVQELLDTVEYDYPNFHLSIDCYICKIKSGDLVLKEHEAAAWLTKETLYSVVWLPADQGLIEKIEDILENGKAGL